MNNPQRHNAFLLKHMLELTRALRKVGESGATGVILAGNGSVLSSGHDFADAVGQDLAAMRKLLRVCTDLKAVEVFFSMMSYLFRVSSLCLENHRLDKHYLMILSKLDLCQTISRTGN